MFTGGVNDGESVTRVLQVVHSLQMGGAERGAVQLSNDLVDRGWEVDVCAIGLNRSETLHHALPKQVQVWHLPIRATGGLTDFLPQNVFSFVREFAGLCRGRDVKIVHAHVNLLNGLVLAAAKVGRVPARIAHGHTELSGDTLTPLGRVYPTLARLLLKISATGGTACSEGAMEPLFGRDWRSDTRWQIIPNAVDLHKFSGLRQRDVRDRRRDLLHLGHVGSFLPGKNQVFLVEMLQQLINCGKPTHLDFVGDGPDRRKVERMVSEKGLERHATFFGTVDDVVEVMQRWDGFVFPSLYEAQPMALLEAQAAGLPCLVSTAVSPEATVVPDLVTTLDLAVGPAIWADKASRLAAAGERNRPGSREIVNEFQKAGMDRMTHLSRILDLYVRSMVTTSRF